ncbi:MAG: LLM class flavin-dependent oxidoreductase [Acidimicrobiales bacterium]
MTADSTGSPELWTTGVASPRRVAGHAAAAEAAGWDGLVVVDSQNLSGDCYVALTMAAQATERLRLGTGVTNPVTRHPAVTAAAIGSVHAVSDGRAVLGIGRGDSALAHLGRAPASPAALEHYVAVLQRYLAGDEVPFDELGFAERVAPPVDTLALAHAPDASRVAWLPGRRAKVPVEVAATGPKVLAAAARTADRVLLALGADPERVAWGIDAVRSARAAAGLDPDGIAIGSYVNVVAHPDLAEARALARGGLSTFARFSVMHGKVASPAGDEVTKVLEQVHHDYDMTEHTRTGSAQADLLTDGFVDSMAIVGSPEHCVDRLSALIDLGVSKLLFVGPSAGSDPAEAERSRRLVEHEVLPALR